MNTLQRQFLDSSFGRKPLTEIVGASPGVLKGISAQQAAKLLEWFGISTIRELAESTIFQSAQALQGS
jgi:hypothetical protein